MRAGASAAAAVSSRPVLAPLIWPPALWTALWTCRLALLITACSWTSFRCSGNVCNSIMPAVRAGVAGSAATPGQARGARARHWRWQWPSRDSD